jgi:hypothetical protein
MAPGCPTQVAEKPKTECGNLIRQVKAKADRMPNYLKERSSLCCTNTKPASGIGCSRRTSILVDQPAGSEPFGNKPYYNNPISNDLKTIATMWDTKGTNGYPQKSTDLPKESQTLTSFQNDVLKFGRVRKRFGGVTEGRPGDARYCKARGLQTQLWNEGQGHKELVAALNTAKSKGCF